MRYVDRLSAVVADTYLAEREVLVSEEERHTRDLLDSPAPGTWRASTLPWGPTRAGRPGREACAGAQTGPANSSDRG
jgi:hypothetical protein